MLGSLRDSALTPNPPLLRPSPSIKDFPTGSKTVVTGQLRDVDAPTHFEWVISFVVD